MQAANPRVGLSNRYSSPVLCRNIFHFLTHGLASIFVTLSELGLLPDTITSREDVQRRAGTSTALCLGLPGTGIDTSVLGRRMFEDYGEAPENCTIFRPSSGILLLAREAKQLESKRAFLLDRLASRRYDSSVQC